SRPWPFPANRPSRPRGGDGDGRPFAATVSQERKGDAMRTRFARVLGLSAALLPLTFVSSARAQAPANVGRQVGGQILNNVGNAAVGQPATAVPGQPGGYGYPVTPGQAVQGMERQAIYNAAGAVTGQPGYMPG